MHTLTESFISGLNSDTGPIEVQVAAARIPKDFVSSSTLINARFC